MSARAAELRAKGADVFAFSVGEPDFEPPHYVLDAARAAVEKGVSKYTAVSGIAPLKEAICAKTEQTRGWKPSPNQVTVSVGATPVFVPTTRESGFKMSPDAFAKALSPKTKAVILCTPSNPTGSAYSEDEMRALLDVWKKTD